MRDSDQCNYQLRYQSVFRCLKSDPTRIQAINVTDKSYLVGHRL